ncbi:hypothetical protein ACLOJK_007707 [Asimina triloba]
MAVALLCILMAVALSRATMEKNDQECADQLQNLASCIPFVSGSAKKPTQQCCDETGKVRSKKHKCLGVLIKESTDPTLALPINTTLALQMPSACNIDAKVSDCPGTYATLETSSGLSRRKDIQGCKQRAELFPKCLQSTPSICSDSPDT